MPTAGRLAAAVAFFIYGWYIGLAMTPFFPEGVPPWYLIPLTISVSLIIGWRIVGGRAGRGYAAAIGNGLTGAFAFATWVIFLISGYDMIQRSLRRLYDGPMEAVVDVFNLMLEQGIDLANPGLILSVAIGGVIGAFVSEYFARRYP